MEKGVDNKTMKLCIDCKYFVHSKANKFFSLPKPPECLHPKNIETNLVTGRKHFKYSPDSLRAELAVESCNKDGRWFEPK